MSHTLSDCHYCGMPADTRDHIIPISWNRKRRKHEAGETVPCCRECNSLLGAKPLFSVQERAHEISECLMRRYRKELNAPVWSDEEMEQLEGDLRRSVEAKQFLRMEILERVRNASSVAYGLLEAALPLHEIEMGYEP